MGDFPYIELPNIVEFYLKILNIELNIQAA